MSKDHIVTDIGYQRALEFNRRLNKLARASKEFDDTLERERLDRSNITMDLFDNASYAEKLQSAQEYLLAQACILNGVESKKFIKKHGDIKENINPFSKEFTDDSGLWNTKKSTSSQSSIVFRSRFITAIITDYITRLDEIVNAYCKGPIKISKIDMLAKCVDNVIDLINRLMTGESYHEQMTHIIYQVMICYKSHETGQAYIEQNKKVIEWIDGDRDWSDRKAYSRLMKSVFTVLTNTRGMLKPKIDIDHEDLTKDEKVLIIKMLGGSIIAYHNDDKMISPLYFAWSLSRPRIKTRFKNVQDDPELNQGCRALEFWAFMCDDQCVRNFVSKLIR